ncbi:GNAT family N-acetyltransferase [Leifsonia poae]|uniref:GNAT family N-acetyltransferase n=1 Tax=Leifsonia poae TaxID=110933 RepID=UPI001CBE1FFA|nr:GNAT family protein [Leifsonia poae]
MSNEANDAPHGATGLPYGAQEVATERLLLRPLNAGDLDDVHEYQKLKDVVRYLYWEVHDHEESAEHLKKRIAMRQLSKDGDGLIYAVELPDPAGGHGRVVGDMSIFLKNAQFGQVEIGWVFHPAVHGRGYATEAAEAVLKICFDIVGAHRVFAQLDPRNEASSRLCERLGMRKEAHLRQNEIFKGEWGDTAVYGILDDEYRAR